MNILVIGATSTLAQACLQHYANNDNQLVLAARNQQRLATLAQDLTIKGAKNIRIQAFDAVDLNSHIELINNSFETFSTIDLVLIAHGDLINQQQCQQNPQLTQQSITINATSTINLLTLIANRLEQQKNGTIAVITSVAGDRGRAANYVYGSAKAMVSTFLDGMRQRLSSSNINVCDIKPGPFDSPMTANMQKGLLWSRPEKIAQRIVKKIAKGNSVVYAPGYWWGVMWLIKRLHTKLVKFI